MRKIFAVFSMLLVLGLNVVMFIRTKNKMDTGKDNAMNQVEKENAERKAYDESARELLNKYVAAENKLENLSAMISDVWTNTVSKKSDPKTDPFTKDASGEFHSDAKTALDLLAKDPDFAASLKELRALCTDLSNRVNSLSAPKFAVVTETELKTCATSFSEYADAVMNTTGTVTMYSSTCYSAKAKFDAACNMLRMHVGN